MGGTQTSPAVHADWFDGMDRQLRAWLSTRVADPFLVDDIIASTCECAMRAQQRGSIEEVTPGWLQVVARRRLIDHWRAQAGQQGRAERLASEVCLVVEPHDPDADALPAWVDELPERQRRALVLRYVDGHSVAEVARRLESSYGATESLLARSRRGARQLLAA